MSPGAQREAVKGVWEGADISSFEPFLYPVLKVDLLLRRRGRSVLLGGRTGRELSL
ncbi:MAG: hypothetical protein HY296_04000 [Thaumarchaeota archaeon]|nr:hypothetical protein [Nitrososphaerota archaeon]